jgi:peptidylprolyl isomerase
MAKKTDDSSKKADLKKTPAKKKEASASSNDKVAKQGDKVKVEYVGSFSDGKIFDSSVKQGKPIEFVVGSGQVIKGFEAGVLGKKVGEEVVVKIEPKDGYGEKNAQLVKIIKRAQLPPTPEPKKGRQLLIGLANGAEVPAFISDIKGDSITIDFNHPLAGKTLNFKIKLIEIN